MLWTRYKRNDRKYMPSYGQGNDKNNLQSYGQDKEFYERNDMQNYGQDREMTGITHQTME